MFMQCVCLEIIIGHLVSEKDHGANVLLSIGSVAGSLPLTYHSFRLLVSRETRKDCARVGDRGRSCVQMGTS